MDENDVIDQPGLEAAFQQALERTPAASADVVQEPAPEPTPAATPEPTPSAQPDYWSVLSEKTGGVIKDEESLNAIMPKAKGYDDLETKLRDLETKIPSFKNDETKVLYEAWANGDKAAVVNYIRETEKDYKTMSDIDVVREALSKKNPDWTSKDVELELRAEYGKQLEMVDLNTIDQAEEPEAYEKALAHNERAEENLLRLQRAARDSRLQLIEQQSKIELPKLAQAQEAAVVSTQPTAEELEQRQAAWVRTVEDNIGQLNNIRQTIDDKEVEYSYNADELKAFGDKMKTFNIFNYAKERGWIGEDGSPDFIKLGRDVQKIEDFDKITKSFSTQVKTETTKDTLKKIKNIDDPKRTVSPDDEPASFEDAYVQARQKAGW